MNIIIHIKNLAKKILSPKQETQTDINQPYTIGAGSLIRNFNIRLDIPCPNKKFVSIGENSLVSGQYIFESSEGEISIGNNTFIGSSTFICRTKITIGDNVNIAWGCTIYDHDSHSQDYQIRRNDVIVTLRNSTEGRNPATYKNWSVVKSAPITIQNDAWIGMNCIILKGVTIGEGAIIGAGAVVTHDIPAWTMAAGNPAQIIKKIPH